MIPILQKHVLTEPDRARTPNNICVIDNEPENVHCIDTTATYGHLMSDVELPLRIASAVTAQCDIDTNLPVYNEAGEIIGYEPVAPFAGYDTGYTYWLEKDEYGSYVFKSECDTRKILRYPTLLEWYQFLSEYYNNLKYTCDGIVATRIFDSYVDLIRDPAYNGFLNIDLATAQKMDDLATARGGKIFFEWASENCFPTYTPPSGTTLPTLMTYDMVMDEIKWFAERQQHFDEWENIDYDGCRTLDNCCDCQKFLDKGGFETYQWLMSIEPPRAAHFCTRTASFTLPVALTNEIENIGTYSLLAKEYNEQKNYSSDTYLPDEVGTVTLYKGKSCFLKLGEDGFEYDPLYEEILWGNLMPGTYHDPDGYQEKSDEDKEWVDGIEIYKKKHNIIETDISATGVTSSKLPDLRDTKTFVDENSNVLPGSLNKDQNGVYVTPNTNEVLDIIYHEGNLANIKMLSTQYNSRGTVGLYSADYISEIVFYKKKNDGTEVLHTSNLHDLDFVDYYPLNVPFSQQERLQDGVFCNITYWTNILFQKADYGQYIGIYRMVYPNEPAYYNAVGSELSYTETLLLTMVNNHPYWLNGSTSIPISYYLIEPLAVSNEEQTALATYYLKYKKYSKINDYNGEIYSPVYFNENYIGISQPESVGKSIYIDRGVNSAMQARLRLGDASCLNDLLQLGNGYFNVMKNN